MSPNTDSSSRSDSSTSDAARSSSEALARSQKAAVRIDYRMRIFCRLFSCLLLSCLLLLRCPLLSGLLSPSCPWLSGSLWLSCQKFSGLRVSNFLPSGLTSFSKLLLPRFPCILRGTTAISHPNHLNRNRSQLLACIGTAPCLAPLRTIGQRRPDTSRSKQTDRFPFD